MLLQQSLNAMPFGLGHRGDGEAIAFLQYTHLLQWRLSAQLGHQQRPGFLQCLHV